MLASAVPTSPGPAHQPSLTRRIARGRHEPQGREWAHSFGGEYPAALWAAADWRRPWFHLRFF